MLIFNENFPLFFMAEIDAENAALDGDGKRVLGVFVCEHVADCK